MRDSDIFNEFVKIAKEKGLISENDSEKSKKKLEQTHRADSLDISAIEALYGTKPKMPKDMEYKRNIIEDAHPDSLVISPSYDKLNGLIENNNERQDIILNILHKTPNGHLTQHKYAKKEFLLSLVKIANELDNKNQDDLRALADYCLLQTNKQLKKEALFPAIMLGAGAIASILGIVWAQQHLADTAQGLIQDYTNLKTVLSKFLSGNSNFGIGHKYSDELKTDVQGFIDRLDNFIGVYNSLSDVFRQMETPEDHNQIIEAAKNIKDSKIQSVLQAQNKLKTVFDNISPYIAKIKKDFSSDVYKSRHTKETGGVSSLLEKYHLSGGMSSLTGNDFQAALNAISVFEEDVSNTLKYFSEIIPEKKQEATTEIAAAQGTSAAKSTNLPSTEQDSKAIEGLK